MPTIVITGASSGIGKATAKYFAGQGWKVAATMRTPENETELTQVDNITLYQLDVTDEESIASAAAEILSDFGTVDVVLNNTGYGLAGPFEAISLEQIERQFNTNVFGLMSVTRAFLPHFRENRAGMFINVSSIGGVVTFPLFSLYHSSKWAIEGFSESLSYEAGEFGVQVKIIEPGGVSTDFAGRSLDLAMPYDLPEYQEMVANYMKNAGGTLGGSTPEQLAEAIFEAATDGKHQLRYLIGQDAHRVYGLRRESGVDAFIEAMKQRIRA